MAKPFLRLGPKQWKSGIASGAHVEGGGIFYQANGVTPYYDAGGSASVENGLLQAGATPTDFTGSVIVDTIIGGTVSNWTATPYLWMLGINGHFYQKGVGSGAPTDLRSGTPITNPRTGIDVWSPAGGTAKLYYWNGTQIGTWDMAGTYPTGWTDNAYTGTSCSYTAVPTHKFAGNLYYGGNENIGALIDNGDTTASHSTSVLDFPDHHIVTGLTDDGTYLVISISNNIAGASFYAVNKIYFWDTFSSSWTREYEIPDPCIYALESIGTTIYAFGQYGVYAGNIGSGFKKIVSRNIGTDIATHLSDGYGINRSATFNHEALVFLTASTIDTFGKLQPDVPSAYFKHFKITDGGTPTFITADLDIGRIYVGTTTPKLYAYDFNNATHDSGNTAQTVYIEIPAKIDVNRIDLVFGEPLASGDAISVGIYKDQDTAVTTFGSATFAADGAIRRKSLYKGATVEEQLSILLTFTSGAVKLKYVELYGDLMES